tara:strand:+ start:9290 stop:12124 length:2835 start_codon:yes stop_codon:yes gene_type:complete
MMKTKKHISPTPAKPAAWLKVMLAVFFVAGFLMGGLPVAEAQSSATVTSRVMKEGSSLNLARLQAQISNVRQVSQAQEPPMDQLDAEIAAYRAGPKAQLNSDVSATQTTLDAAEQDVDDTETILSTVKPHARQTPSTCGGGEVLSFDTDANSGSGAWLCTDESDPNAGPHAAVGLTPPVCAAGNGTAGNPGGKLIWNGSQWRCLTDSAINTGLVGPQGAAGADGPAGDPGTSIWTQTGSHIYYSANYVGIGTATPTYWLHVVGNTRITGNADVGGSIKLGNSSTCNSTYHGALRYNTSTDEFLICQNNNTWGVVDLGGMGDCGSSDCALPWGGIIANGSSVTAYQQSSVPYGSSCSSQTRTCSSGTLSGSYTKESCSTLPAADCGTPWGGLVPHGGSTIAYQAASVAYGASCTSQTRSCFNGALSGGYQYETCTPEAAPSTCALPWGGSLAHGSSVTAYQNSDVPYGSSCVSQTRTCTDGSLSGSYTNANCNVASPNPCSLPWGGSIAHGNTVTAYAANSVGCGSSCSSQTRTCSNGSLSGSYAYQNCSVSSCNNCTLDGVTVNHGSSRTFYTSTSVACGSTCSGGTRTCSNGAMSGSTSYNRANCSVASCANCTLDGVTVNHGSSRAFYQTSRACGQACTAIDQTRSCTNGTLSGTSSYSKASCPAENCTCTPTTATSFSNVSGEYAYGGGTYFGPSISAATCKTFCENEKATVCLHAADNGYCYAFYSGSSTLDASSTTYTSKWTCPGGTNNAKKCSYFNGTGTEAVPHGASRNPVCGICTATPGGSQTCSNATWPTLGQYTPGWNSCSTCKVICTELHAQGLLSDEIYKADQLYGRTISSPAAMKVYSLWGVPTAQLMSKSPLVTAIVRPLATAWAEHMAYEMGVTEDDNLLGRMLRMTFLPLHEALGAVFYPELNEAPSAEKPGMPSEAIPVATLPGLKK